MRRLVVIVGALAAVACVLCTGCSSGGGGGGGGVSRSYALTTIPVAVIGQDTATGRLYGSELSNTHYAVSDDGGASWKDTGFPTSATEDVVQVVNAGTWTFAITSAGKVYRCALNALTGWKDVSAPCPPLTTGRPDVLAYNGTYLFYGTYNGNSTEGAHVYRSPDFGAHWTEVLAPAGSRHVHAVYIDPQNPSGVFVTIGDSGFTNIGLWYSADSGSTWSHLSSNMYGIDMTIPGFNVRGQRTLLMEGDGKFRPHIMGFPLGMPPSPGSTVPIINAPAPPKGSTVSPYAGTGRGVKVTAEGNLFFISTSENGTAGGTRDALWFAQGPDFVKVVMLQDITNLVPHWYYNKSYEAGPYIYNFHYRITIPTADTVFNTGL